MKKVAARKLVLAKETLRSLDHDEMRRVVGGSVVGSDDGCTRDGSNGMCPGTQDVDCSASGHRGQNRF